MGFGTNADIKILVACHKDGVLIPDVKAFAPIQVGAAGKKHIEGMLHDDQGDNISSKNSTYCELTGQYWAWKNLDADFYGQFHYRRYFNFTDEILPVVNEPFIAGDVVEDRNDADTLARLQVTDQRIQELMAEYEFIAAMPSPTPDGANVYDQYRLSYEHHIEDFDAAIELVQRLYPHIWPSAQKYLAQDSLYSCNMFIMSKEIFQDYCAFLFDVLGRLETLRDASHYSSVGRRVWGYVGERLCGMYLTYLYDSGRKGKNLQRVYFRDVTDPAAKAAADEAPKPRKVQLRYGSITRGSEKIYLPVSAAFPAAITASATTSDGKPLPAKVMRIEDGRDILVVPITDCDQRVAFNVVNEITGEKCVAHAILSARLTKLAAKRNTVLRGRTIDVYRNIDEEPQPGDAWITLNTIVPDGDRDIVRGEVHIPLADGDPDDAFIEITALDRRGNPMGGTWVCVDDQVEVRDGHKNLRLRIVTFSVYKPAWAPFIVWARFPDGQHTDGFACFGGAVVAKIRGEFAARTLPACNDSDYEAWFTQVHRATPDDLAMQRASRVSHGLTFSIVVPLFRTPIDFFWDMERSVLEQTYGKWQLVLVNASPEDEALAAAVKEACEADSRVVCVPLEENLGITENTNAGIQACTGDFICFFDHDDVLEPDALYWYAQALEDNPEIDLLYCDEDKLMGGHYANPFFKPDWDIDLMMGMNYVCHFLTCRASIVKALEPPTREFDGSQDYHMTLRVAEKARAVHHEPRVLYHWRVHEHSTAGNAEQKDYTLESSRLSLSTYLERNGLKGQVLDSPLSPRRFYIDYDLANEQGEKPLVSIVIPNKDSLAVLYRCIASILKCTTYENYEIVVVENNSTDPNLFKYYEGIQMHYPNVRVEVLEGLTSFNFSKIMNFGCAAARGEYLLLLNNDTEVITPNWIEQLLGTCMRTDVGATGAKLFFANGTIQHAGVMFGPDGPGHVGYEMPVSNGGNFESLLLAREVTALTGACLMVKASAWKALSGMDENLAVNYNDVDLCLRVKNDLGLKCVFVPTAQLTHYESVTRGSELMGPKAIRFRTEKGALMQKWPQYFETCAPQWNPNFEPGNPYEHLDWKPELAPEAPKRGLRSLLLG